MCCKMCCNVFIIITATVEKVDDLVPCNSYVLVELGNSCVKTRPIPKTGNPVWDQTFEL